jgi:hypothetical protein
MAELVKGDQDAEGDHQPEMGPIMSSMIEFSDSG